MNRESDGERAVRVALDNLRLKYEQEKEINFLKGDFKGSRKADFFLPKYNIYIEYLGGWDKKNSEERKKERTRYNKKKDAYRIPVKLVFGYEVPKTCVRRVQKKLYYRMRSTFL